MKDTLKRLWRDERGPTLLEYAGLAVLLIIAIWVAGTQLAGGVKGTFDNMKGKLGG